MNTKVLAWRAMRITRWLLWIAFVGYGVYVSYFREQFMTEFGHLSPTAELMLFGLGQAAVFAGLMELMVRDWAGMRRKPAATGIAR